MSFVTINDTRFDIQEREAGKTLYLRDKNISSIQEIKGLYPEKNEVVFIGIYG